MHLGSLQFASNDTALAIGPHKLKQMQVAKF